MNKEPIVKEETEYPDFPLEGIERFS